MKYSSPMILKQMEIGPLQNFIYFVGDPVSLEIAVVDPAWDVAYLIKEAQSNNTIDVFSLPLKVGYILTASATATINALVDEINR